MTPFFSIVLIEPMLSSSQVIKMRPIPSFFAGDLDGQTEDGSSVAQPTEFRNDDIADMSAHTLKRRIE